MYCIENIPLGSRTLVIQNLSNEWQIKLPGIRNAIFTDDSRDVIYMAGQDTLCRLELSSGRKDYILSVKTFQLFKKGGKEWLACQHNNKSHELQFLDLASGSVESYQNVERYVLSRDAKTMLLVHNYPDSEGEDQLNVSWVDFSSGEGKAIWKGRSITALLGDLSGTRWALLGEDNISGEKKIWRYWTGDQKTIQLVSVQAPGMPSEMEPAGLVNFSENGDVLYFTNRKKPLPKIGSAIEPVNIWSYADAKLQSEQIYNLIDDPLYMAVVQMSGSPYVNCIQQENERVRGYNDNHVLLYFVEGNEDENYWNRKAVGQTWLVNIANNTRTHLPLLGASLSPSGKYVLGYGPGISFYDLFVYEISTGNIRNLTADIHIPLNNDDRDLPSVYQKRGLNLAVWLANDSSLLVYDSYDIWQLDPLGRRAPINQTQGRRFNWQFRLAENQYTRNPMSVDSKLLLKAFNTVTKDNGFYQLELGSAARPQLLYKGSVSFFDGLSVPGKSVGYFLRARDTAVYLVMRERCDESPNLFKTKDFRTFMPVSQVYPEKDINWFHPELLRFSTADKRYIQAILYKPDDFDSTRKYPLIIHYYDRRSDELNHYQMPATGAGGGLDISWFASHGYLVLLTDIHYKMGQVGPSAQECIEGAAKYMSRFAFVDSKHIGIQGMSLGAYETNFLVTHSKTFAAAVSSCGVSDLAPSFGIVYSIGYQRARYVEGRGYCMGTTPWENPRLYVLNSPIYHVKNVNTPILMMANRQDGYVEFGQGLELFTALRRAGKKAWMLEYDHGAHGVNGSAYKDFLIRMTQFFDFYLKGASAPIWMTRGIPASQKGLTTGYEYDLDVKMPGPGLLKQK